MVFAQDGNKTPLNLKVTVNTETAGTLFVKIQEQIEEIGELYDVSELTVNGPLNGDDYNVINHQLTNLTLINLSGLSNIYREGRLELHLPSLKTIVLPDTLTSLEGCSVSECTGIEHISLPDGITEIPANMFWYCSSLKQIDLPSKLKTIHDAAFGGTALTSFTLPAGVTLNGESIFYGCAQLVEFTFPDGLKDASEVGTATFRECGALKKVRLPNDLTEIPAEFFHSTALDTIVFPAAVTKIGAAAFCNISTPLHVVMPDQITEIGNAVFYGSQIEEVVWPSGCPVVPEGAFRYCYNLKKVTLPETVTTLEAGTQFYECVSLTSIHLPDAITRIGYLTFASCNLTEANIPKACTYIDGWAFAGCSLKHVDLPDAITHIGERAFASNPLEELVLPAKIRNIGELAFDDGRYKKVVVPEGCLGLGAGAFHSLTLRCLDLPSTLVYMEGAPVGNLWGDGACDSIVFRSVMPPKINDYCIGEYDFNKITLYVPSVSVGVYEANERYSKRAAAIEAFSGEIVNTDLLTIAGNVVITPTAGLYAKKYDVNFFQTELNQELFDGRYSYDHPRLTIAQGATLQTGIISMTVDRNDYHYGSDYSWDVFINKGTCTADQIDLRWRLKDLNYFSPAFDTRMADIVPEREGAPFAIYRFDPAARAVGNFEGSWIKVGNAETLKAGVGYLFRGQEMFTGEYTEHTSWGNVYRDPVFEWVYQHHRSYPGGQNYFLTNSDVTLPVTHAAGEFAHNKNWNLVGQPYPAFLDIRGIDYDGPILLPRGKGGWDGRWIAYSPLDDEIVIEPMQAFFVQVPDGTDAITLDADRRQTSQVYTKDESTNSRRALRRADSNARRVVFNATLSRSTEPSGNSGDSGFSRQFARTRFVINPEATTRYDIGRDAPAMADDDATLLYTMAGGVAYAINERPLADGIIRLGMQLAEPGTYALALSLKSVSVHDGNTAVPVFLIDNETGTRVQLLGADGTPAEPYAFEVTEPCTLSSRFVIAIGDADPTAITDVEVARPLPADALFNLAGQRINTPQRGIYINNGKKMLK